jgi:hypothetical protein
VEQCLDKEQTYRRAPYSSHNPNGILNAISYVLPNIYLFFQAIQSDFDCCFEADNQEPSTSPPKKSVFSSTVKSTIYGRQYLLTAFDEVHNCRNINKTYWAAFALRETSHMTVGMSATPVTNHPMVCGGMAMLLRAYSVTRTCGTSVAASVWMGFVQRMMNMLRKWNACYGRLNGAIEGTEMQKWKRTGSEAYFGAWLTGTLRENFRHAC